MDNSENLKNIALLIDADNTTPAGIDPVLTVMAELGQVNIRRAYGNFAKQALSKWGRSPTSSASARSSSSTSPRARTPPTWR